MAAIGDHPEAERVRRLRDLIPATGAGIYLDTANRGPILAEAAAAMRDADEGELRVGRATEGRDDDVAQKRDEARAVIAALIGADPADIRLTADAKVALAGLKEVVIRPHVDPDTGAVLSARVPESGWLALDASLSAGAIPIDVATLGADFVTLPGDRWLLGPEATGALWIGPRPRAAGVDVPDQTLGRTQILGLARSLGWLEMYVGLPWVYERGQALASQLRGALAALDGLEMLTPASMATVVCFRLSAWPTDQLLTELRRRVFAIIGATPDGSAIRASVAWFNTEDEIDRFASAVAEIARHTPDTLPRQKTLEML